jgi:hypothetical protein
MRRIPLWLRLLVVLAAMLVTGQHATMALRSPGHVIGDSLRAAAGELKHAPGTLPGDESLRAIPGHFRRWQATIDPTGFPAEVAITLYSLDRVTCREAAAVARRIEGWVVIELEGYRTIGACRDENDMTWRLMP